jgi:hypothetical protein
MDDLDLGPPRRADKSNVLDFVGDTSQSIQRHVLAAKHDQSRRATLDRLISTTAQDAANVAVMLKQTLGFVDEMLRRGNGCSG